MKKILNSLAFPAVSFFLVLAIYGSLTIANLDKKAQAAKNDGAKYDQQILQLQESINQYREKLNEVISTNNELSGKIANSTNQNFTTTTKEIPVQNILETKTVYQTEVREVDKNQATVTIQNVGSYTVALSGGESAFSILEKASKENSFPLKYDNYSFGVFVTGIAGIIPSGNQYWSFFYD